MVSLPSRAGRSTAARRSSWCCPPPRTSPAGEFAVALRADPGEWAFWGGVRVTGGGETILRYPFARFGKVSVRILGPAGDPVRDALVHVAESGCLLGSTDQEGWTEWTRAGPLLPAGVVHLLICGPDRAPVLSGPVDSCTETEVEVGLAGPGRLLPATAEDRTGRPVAGGTVLRLLEDGPMLPAGTIDLDGSLEGSFAPPPGPVRLRVEAEDGRRGDLTLRPGAAGLSADLR